MSRQADALRRYFEGRAKKGFPEARREWLYGEALIKPGTRDQEKQLDEVIREVKDAGAGDGFELVYVYNRPGWWTCQPSDYVRRVNFSEEVGREAQALDRIARCAPSESDVAMLAAGLAQSGRAALAMAKSLVADAEPEDDPVLVRIDYYLHD